MSNTINVNGMTSYYSTFIKSVTAKTSVNNGSKVNSGTMNGEKDSFISTLSSKVETAGTLEETAAVSTKDMTMEEYKQYISDQISKFRIDSSRSGDQYSINISDAGFEAMKNDPEYENWVLDYIRRDMAVAAPGWYTAMGGPSAYCILNFGATKEERTGEMFSAGYMNGKGTGIFNSHADKSFWSRRADTKKQIEEQAQKRAIKKKQMEEELAQIAAKKRYNHQQMMQDYYNEWLANNGINALGRDVVASVGTSNTMVGAAISSYEASFVTAEMM